MNISISGEYILGCEIPLSVGKGKFNKSKDNDNKVELSPKIRNQKYGYFEIPAKDLGPKESAKLAALRAERKSSEKAGNNNEIIH